MGRNKRKVLNRAAKLAKLVMRCALAPFNNRHLWSFYPKMVAGHSGLSTPTPLHALNIVCRNWGTECRRRANDSWWLTIPKPKVLKITSLHIPQQYLVPSSREFFVLIDFISTYWVWSLSCCIAAYRVISCCRERATFCVYPILPSIQIQVCL